MITGNVLASEFPQRRVQVADIDDIAGSITYLDSIANTIRLANENIYPSDETLHRRLHSQCNND